MRRLIRSRLIWIYTACKCVSVFTWCPNLPDFTLASKNDLTQFLQSDLRQINASLQAEKQKSQALELKVSQLENRLVNPNRTKENTIDIALDKNLK